MQGGGRGRRWPRAVDVGFRTWVRAAQGREPDSGLKRESGEKLGSEDGCRAHEVLFG